MSQLARISTTVVKGTRLDHPDSLEIGANGHVRDRLFHFVDANGVMFSSKRHGQMVQIGCEYEDDLQVLTMRFPDGTVVADVVETTGEHVETNFWGRPVPATIVAGPFAQAVSDYVDRPVRMVRADVPGTATDLHPVTMIANTTLDLFADKLEAPKENFRDRFRMTLEIDGLEAFEEETWPERQVRIGDVLMTVVHSVPRCLVTRQDPVTGVKDFDSLKALRKFRTQPLDSKLPPGPDHELYGGFLLGMYATVDRPGTVHVGDAVQLVD